LEHRPGLDDTPNRRRIAVISHPTEHLRECLESVFPGWQVWVVHRAVDGPVWCARRDGTGPVLNASTPEALGKAMARVEPAG
jgi:hypothetical protein